MIKEEYLKKYLPGFALPVLTEEIKKQIPSTWIEILNAVEPLDRKQAVLSIWERYVKSEMSNTLLLFKNQLQRVDLVHSQHGFSLLYTFEIAGKIVYREGKNPLTSILHTSVEALWNQVPPTLTQFYKSLHNGWFELPSEAMGLLPTENIALLSGDEWGILDEIEIDFDLEKVIRFFSNGGGGYLCIDLNSTEATGLIWWHDESPIQDQNFWDVLDDWTAMGLQD